MNLSILNISQVSPETRALADLAAQSKDALLRALENLQKQDIIVAEVVRLVPATTSSNNQETVTLGNDKQLASNTNAISRNEAEMPVVLKFPEATLAVSDDQQANLQALVGKEVIVKIDSVVPDIKIRILDTAENYFNRIKQPTNPVNTQQDSKIVENISTTPLPEGPIMLEVLNKLQQTTLVQRATESKIQSKENSNTVISSANTSPTSTSDIEILSVIAREGLKSFKPQTRITEQSRASDITLLANTESLANTKVIAKASYNQAIVAPTASDISGKTPPVPSLLMPQSLTSTVLTSQITESSRPESAPNIVFNNKRQARPIEVTPSVTSPVNDISKTVQNSSLSNNASETISNANLTQVLAQPNSNNKPVPNASVQDMPALAPIQTSPRSVSPQVTNHAQTESLPQVIQKEASQTPAIFSDARLGDLVMPQITKIIEVPERQQYPLLNQAVTKASQRLGNNNPATVSNSFQKLLLQLDRLQNWSADNKRYLRSDQGQPLNKATTDTIGGLKELQRYVAEPKQLSNVEGLKKALRQSGMFADQKRMVKEAPKLNARQVSLHADTKVNLQRIVTATLYHMAKLATLNNTNATTTLSGTTSQTTANPESLLTPKTKSAVPNDLVRMIKQRLNAYGEQQLPAELPKRLMQLLQQVLTHSNQALQRTETQQLANLRSDSQSPQWFFELPIWTGKNTDNLQLLMRRETRNNDQEFKHSWSLMLQFDMHSLGKIRAVVKWHKGQTSLLFLANQPETIALLKDEMATMRERASHRNIDLAEVDVKQSELTDMRFEISRAEQ